METEKEMNTTTKPIVPQEGSGLAVASMILGIVGITLGIICWCFYGLSGMFMLIMGCIGLPMGVISSRRIKEGTMLINARGFATTGIILGVINIVVGVLTIVLWGIGITAAVLSDVSSK